ncbi:Dirigent protein [Dioscorea alata]|uniref:Dirigent protein n=1 Tax=Dioscorea alata TaxID=55571 RepID=A0ACB7UUF6_DIOAL|nr:Dirigent protein [Dioscorea alata]
MNDKRMNNINVLLLFLLFVLTLVSQGHAQYQLGKEKVTDIHFYYQENLKADPPTAVLVAKPEDTKVNATTFLPYGADEVCSEIEYDAGATYVLDTPLTAEQDPNSEVVGQAQGLAASAGQNQSLIVFAVDYIFTSGKFKDSSVKLAIVGGRGKFRMASGYAIVRTIYRNITSAVVIVEYNVTVFHYE